jgi:hypothetical protein
MADAELLYLLMQEELEEEEEEEDGLFFSGRCRNNEREQYRMPIYFVDMILCE